MNSEVFEALFSSHAADVYRYISRRHAGSDLEDLVAEVFTVAWQKRDEIPTEFELPWLYRTAWYIVANAHRKTGDIPMETYVIDEATPDIADVVIHNAEMREVWLAIPERDREVLRLVAWEGLTPPQVAAVLGLSLGGASSAISRARKNLAAEFHVQNS